MRIIRTAVNVADTGITMTLPVGDFLSAAPTRGEDEYIDLWHIDQQDGNNQTVRVIIVGTGMPLPFTAEQIESGELDDLIFLDTCVMPSGLVWHVWVAYE